MTDLETLLLDIKPDLHYCRTQLAAIERHIASHTCDGSRGCKEYFARAKRWKDEIRLLAEGAGGLRKRIKWTEYERAVTAGPWC